MRNQTLFTILFILVAYVASAQERYFDERYVYTQSFMFPVLINPGAIGESGDHELLFNYRNNWASFEDAPKTVTFSYNGALGNRVGFGAALLKDSYGALETTKGQVGFSYSIESMTNRLGFGITTEYIQHRIGGGLSGVDLQDPTILRRLDGAQFFDISVGVSGLYDGTVSYGLVFPSLVSSRLSDAVEGGDDNDLGFILHAGYDYHAVGNGIHIIPSVFVKKLRNVPTHVDVNMRLNFLDEKLTSGVTYRVGADKLLGFLIGTKIDKVGFYYSYNISNEEVQVYNSGTHEITFSLNLSNAKQETGMDIK